MSTFRQMMPNKSLSDHYAVCAVRHNKCSPENKSSSHKVIGYRKMKDFNEQQFWQELYLMPWNDVLLYNDPNEALEVWYQIFLKVLDNQAPKVKKRVETWKQPE